jgi:hypothetical protein
MAGQSLRSMIRLWAARIFLENAWLDGYRLRRSLTPGGSKMQIKHGLFSIFTCLIVFPLTQDRRRVTSTNAACSLL